MQVTQLVQISEKATLPVLKRYPACTHIPCLVCPNVSNTKFILKAKEIRRELQSTAVRFPEAI